VVGYHGDAQLDLDQAKKKARALGDRAPVPPEWVALLDPFLRYDIRHLQSDRPTLASLAGLLRLLAVEFPFERSQTLPIAQQVLAREPDCFRAIDAICQVGGLNDLHVATVLGPRMLETVVPAKVKALEQLPAGVLESIEANRGEPALVEALRQAGKPDADVKEPSWGVLGHLIAETRFIHVWRRLAFMRNRWSVPVDNFWAESLLSVARHPYRRYLESFTLGPQDAAEVLAELLDQLDAGSLENKEYPMTTALARLPGPRASVAWKVGVVHLDGTAHDLSERMFTGGNMVKYAPSLLEASPHSPYARAVMIEKDWENAKTKLAEWEADADSADSPTLLAALGKRYTEMGRIDDAQKVLKRYIAQSPSYWAYALLARNEKDRGNLELWKTTLDEYLERGENSGLDHARVQVELARHFMNKRQWSEGLPYAEEAAKTWAGWAMSCAGECNEAMGDYQRAEFWFRNNSERYANVYLAWLNFCGRTYYGDPQAAAQFALRYVNAAQDNLSDASKALAVVLFDLAGQPRDGLEFLRRLIETERHTPTALGGRLDPWTEQMFLARYADDEAVKDDKLRDATWADVAKGDHVAAAAVAGMFRDALAAGKDKPFDTKALDKVLEEADPKSRSYLNYCAGCFFARHGISQDAVRYWEPCFNNVPGCGPYVPLLGRCALGTFLEKRIADDAHQYYLRALIRRFDNRPEESLPDLDKALRLDPEVKEAWNLRAVIKRNLGDLDGAVADFTRLIEIAPDDSYAVLGRAVCRIMQHKDDQAKADIDRAAKLTPKDGFAEAVSGLLFAAQGNEAEAQEMFKKAFDLQEYMGPTIEKLKRDISRMRKTQRSPD
jgi:tetratricopeptide (TPR) repeat protein